MDSEEQSPSWATRHALKAAGAVFLIVACLGLPINDLFHYTVLIGSAAIILTGTISNGGRRWITACAAALLCILVQALWPAPRIEEGHNVFLIDRSGGALES